MQENDYGEAAEGKVDEVVQLQSNVETENMLFIEDSNVNYQEHFPITITTEVRVQNIVDDERYSMQEINTNEYKIGSQSFA